MDRRSEREVVESVPTGRLAKGSQPKPARLMNLKVSLFLQSSNSHQLNCFAAQLKWSPCVVVDGCCQKTNEGGNDCVAEPMRSLRGRDWRGGRMRVSEPINHECSSSVLALPSPSECGENRGLGMTVMLEQRFAMNQRRAEEEELRKRWMAKKVYLGEKEKLEVDLVG